MAQLDNTDFSMKPSVDVSAIASVIQRKKIAEIEAKQAQRTQKMNELTQTIGLASNLASTMVEASKDRQKRAFVESLSQSMAASVPMQTQPFAEPRQVSSMVPPVSSVGSPDLARMDLMRDATRVAPDQAAQHAFKLANPQLNQDQSLSFQRMAFKGSDGKTKTVNVGVLGTALVNPVTKQPFQGTPEEVDTMPEYGFVEREEYSGTDNDGNPVFRNPVEGIAYTKDAKGNPVPYNGAIMPKLQNPSDATGDKVQFITETRLNLKDAIDQFDPKFVGLIDKQYKDIGAFLENSTDPKAEKFRALIEEINITKRHELFGSALTESEKKSFRDISLDRNLSGSAFIARLKSLERKLSNKERALEKSSRVTGKVLRKDSAAPKSFDLGDGFSFTVDEE